MYRTRFITTFIPYCKRCCAEASMKTGKQKRRKRRFNGKLGVAHSMRERQREREWERKHRLYSKTLTQYFVLTCVCVQCTRFIQVLTRTDRSTIVLQCSLRAPTLTPKYIPSGISFLASPRFSAQNRRIRSVPTDSVLSFFSRSGRCWACISTLLKKGHCDIPVKITHAQERHKDQEDLVVDHNHYV